jgi:hypothetical protein
MGGGLPGLFGNTFAMGITTAEKVGYQVKYCRTNLVGVEGL